MPLRKRTAEKATTTTRTTKRRVLGFVAVVVALLGLAGTGRAQPMEPRVLLEGAAFPAGIAFDDDGNLYYSERSGRIRVVRNGRLQQDPVANVPTTTTGEAGLLGLATFERWVYAFGTDPSGRTNRIVRVPLEGGEPEEVFSGMPASPYHNGGGVAFVDGHMFVSNGEAHDVDRSQIPTELGGKIYRLTPTGSIPSDNPFGDSPAWAIGLRNPYGIAVDPVTNDVWATNNGPSSNDEVEWLTGGSNHGWPDINGTAPAGAAVDDLPGEYRDPVLDYPEIIVPTGIAFADPAEAQDAYAGDLFFGTYGEGSIHHVELNEDRTEAVSDEVIVEESDGVIALAWGPGGLYYSTPETIKLLPIAEEAAPEPITGGGRRFRVPRILTALGLLMAVAIATFVVMRRSHS